MNTNKSTEEQKNLQDRVTMEIWRDLTKRYVPNPKDREAAQKLLFTVQYAEPEQFEDAVAYLQRFIDKISPSFTAKERDAARSYIETLRDSSNA